MLSTLTSKLPKSPHLSIPTLQTSLLNPKFQPFPQSTLIRYFSVWSRRQYTPNIIKAGKFSRTGMVVRKWKTPVQYDLTAPHISKPHLYYDHKIDGKIRHKAMRKNRVVRRKEVPLENTSLEGIITDLCNDNLYHRASTKIWLRVQQFEKNHPEQYLEYLPFINNKIAVGVRHNLAHATFLKTYNMVQHLCRYNVSLNSETFQTILYKMISIFSQAAYFVRPPFVDLGKQELRYFRLLYELIHYNQNNFSGQNSKHGEQNYRILSNGILDFLRHSLEHLRETNHKIFLCGIVSSSEFLATDWKSTKPRNKRNEILDTIKSILDTVFASPDRINDKGLSGIGLVNDS